MTNEKAERYPRYRSRRHQAGPRCAQVFARLGAESSRSSAWAARKPASRAVGRKQSAYWVQTTAAREPEHGLAQDGKRRPRCAS